MKFKLMLKRNGFSVVRDFCGHGISTTFHEPPNMYYIMELKILEWK